MKFGFKKENLLDTILSIALTVCLFLAFMGLFAPAAKFSSPWGNADFAFGAAAGSGEPALEAALAFAVLGLIFTFILFELVQLDMFEVLPKDKKWSQILQYARLGLAFVIVVFAVISISCVGGWASKNNWKVAGGSAMHFVFSFLAAACGACIGIKNLLPKKSEPKQVEEKDEKPEDKE